MNFRQPNIPAYPTNVFTGLSGEIMRDLTIGGFPAEIAGPQLMSFISLLTQGIADIAWPNGTEAAIGANVCGVIFSGGGKSLVFKILKKPVNKILLELCSAHNTTSFLNLFVEDVTRESLIQSLSECPVAGLFTDEGGQLSQLFRNTPTLVKLIDGEPLLNARVSTGRVALDGHRLTILLMEQPDIFDKTKRLLGSGNGSVGLLNRFFVTCFEGEVSIDVINRVKLRESTEKAFEIKIRACLESTILHVANGNHKRPTLRLSKEAACFLIGHSDDVRNSCNFDVTRQNISEYLSRHGERVLRLAGALHAFEYGVYREVSLETVQRAATLGMWHNDLFARLMYEPPKQTQAESDAAILEPWIRQYFQFRGIFASRRSELQSYAPNLGLSPVRFNRALTELCGKGIFQVEVRDGKPWIELKRAVFSYNW